MISAVQAFSWETVMGGVSMISDPEAVRQTILDPAEQGSSCSSIGHTAIAVGERGDDTASAACTSILYRVCYDPPQ